MAACSHCCQCFKKPVMKIKFLLLALLSVSTLNTFAQVSINTDGARPDTSAMLDITSTSKGLLIPRLTAQQMYGITTPAMGLQAFNTTDSSFYYYTGVAWLKLTAGGLTLPYTGEITQLSSPAIIRLYNYAPHGDILDLTTASLANDGYALKATSSGKKSAAYFIGNSYANALTTGIGNVGIGVDSAAAHVHIKGGSLSTYPQLMIENNGPSGQDTSFLLFKSSGIPNYWAIKSYNNGTNANERFTFYNSTSGNVLSLNGDGKVGIGTNAPKAVLQVNGTSAINNPQLLLSNLGDDYARLSFTNNYSKAFWTIAGYTGAQGGDILNFYNSRSQQGNIMSITGDGKVGINTTTPTLPLDVHGGVNFTGPLTIATSAGTPGQVLTSNGLAQPSWKTPLNNRKAYDDIVIIDSIKNDPYNYSSDQYIVLKRPNLQATLHTISDTFNFSVQTKVVVSGSVQIVASAIDPLAADNLIYLDVMVDSRYMQLATTIIKEGQYGSLAMDFAVDLPPGLHQFTFSVYKVNYPSTADASISQEHCIYHFYPRD